MNFCLDLCIYIDNSLGVFLGKFSFTSSFLVKKINGFGVKYFIKSKYRRIQTGLAILKKIKDFIFFKRYIFLHNYQKSQFSEIFENHQ